MVPHEFPRAARGNLIVTEQGIRDSVRQVLLPLWNTFQFFQLYSGTSSHTPRWRTTSTDVLDRYVLASCTTPSRR